MKKFLLVGLFFSSFLNPHKSFADTVDVWTIKLNGKVIINSNQTDILYHKHPMKINLLRFADSDSLQICYWTDSGMEKYKWYYLFEDINNSIIYKFTNSFELPNNKTSHHRNNYISFNVKDLKLLMRTKNINKIFVEFKHDNSNWSSAYLHKPICIISNH